jgi:ATP-binding cassette subfamily B protein
MNGSGFALTHRTLRKFLSYYKPYRALLAADLVCALVAAVIALSLPLLARHITAALLDDPPPDALAHIAVIGASMIVLLIVQTACYLFVDYQGHMMGAHMESDMRRELFDHLQKLSFTFYDEQKTGQLMSRLTNDTFAMSELYHHGPEDIVLTVIWVFGTFAILLTINIPLTLLIFLFLPIMGAYAWFFNKRMNRALRASKERIGDINAQLEDTLGGIRVVRSFTNEAVERRKFERENARFVQSRADGYRSEALHHNGLVALTQLITIMVIVVGAAAILGASLTLADLITCLLFIAILTDPVNRLINFARLYQEGITGFDRFTELLDVQPDIADAPGAVDLAHVRGHIQFRHVSFRYREEHDFVLENITLDLQPGGYVALVGSSGVGKSTLCALIPRFYDVTSGQIVIDGNDLRAVTLHSLRSHIGIVQQDVYLFSGTAAENIRYGKLDASDDDVIAAAKKAYAHDFIMALPDGYNTDIGQRGVKLSGGQKQRLSIARVFLKNPPILIFDEATSALDNESERAVQRSLETLAHDRTTLVIAHRLSTVRDARRILVLGERGIEEHGTHDELIARNGAYARLYNLNHALLTP